MPESPKDSPPARTPWSDHLRPRLAPLALSPARQLEIEDELSQHLDDRFEALRAQGVSELEARQLALEELRDHDTIARYMRSLRQARTLPPIPPGPPSRGAVRDALQDLRYAGRMLRRQPGFTVAAVLTLALGIGANTAVFSLVNATLFQRLQVAAPDRLAYISRGNGGVFAYPLYATLRDHNDHFEALAAWAGISASLGVGESAELVAGFIVTGNFFEVLGTRPAALGRLIGASDDVTPGAHPVTVISYDFWQTRFAGDPGVIGRDVRLNGHTFTVVGVTPAGFDGPTLGASRALYVPMMMQAIMRPPRARYSGELNPDLLTHPTNSWLSAIGRLKPGARIEPARTQLETVASEYIRTRTTRPPTPVPGAPLQRISVVPLEEGIANQRQPLRAVALLLGGVVAAVLLIACANIANLLLSRASARRREVAVRLALGASRSRLIRQLLTESVLLSLIGGVAGVALAWGVIAAFRAAPPPPGALPLALDFAIDQQVLLFSLLLSCATGVLFGVAPALEASRPALVQGLKGGAPSLGERRARFDLKQVLVVGEVALSLLLLIAAGLFVRSLQAAQAVDPGVAVDKLISAPLSVNLLRYTSAQGREFYRQTVERVGRLPGVESATVARVALLGGNSRVYSLHVEGRGQTHDSAQSEGGPPVINDPRFINANVVGASFFKTMGIALLNGRDFNERDDPNTPGVVIVSATAAAIHFPDGTPIGSRISIDGPGGPWREVVGVVRDSKYGTLSEGAVPVVYLPLSQNHETGVTLYVRASVPPASLAASLRREIQSLEPNLPVPNIRTMTEIVGTSLYAARMGARLLSVFGGLALLLAVIGIYGVLSFSISRRTREMGIRLALGADTHRVFLLVVRDGMALVAIGILIGLGGGLAAARAIASSLRGVSATDLPTFALTIALLSAVALVACALPARRAIRVDPITALRQE
jgi:macrolide transport system ATP-binding/permease protein